MLSGPEELRSAALAIGAASGTIAHDTPASAEDAGQHRFQAARRRSCVRNSPGCLPDGASQAGQICSCMVPDTIKQKLESRLTLHDGDRITQAVLERYLAPRSTKWTNI